MTERPSIPEVWLRGPIEGIQPLLQPAAHTLAQVGEDVLPIVENLEPARLWARPGNAASIGFHLAHLPGSLDRLLTYSRGEGLSSAAARSACRGADGRPGPSPAQLAAGSLQAGPGGSDGLSPGRSLRQPASAPRGWTQATALDNAGSHLPCRRTFGSACRADRHPHAGGPLSTWIAHQRLHNQRITRPGLLAPARMVAWFGAVQAQEYGPAKWGLALRSSDRTNRRRHRARH